MKTGMDSCAQCAVKINQSNPNLVGGFATRTLGLLKRVLMQDLSSRLADEASKSYPSLLALKAKFKSRLASLAPLIFFILLSAVSVCHAVDRAPNRY